MTPWLNLCSCFLSFLLMSCSPSTTSESISVSNDTPITSTPTIQVKKLTNLGQKLPISAQAILPQGTKIDLEVARTPQEQSMGLMYRPALPDNRGMLFVFPSSQPVQFWMKNVPVALDMVFMNKGVIKYIQASAPPCDKDPCPTYGPNEPIDQVIELRSGRAAELNLRIGNSIKINFLKSDKPQ